MDEKQIQIIADVVKILKQRFADDAAGHGWLHFERVWKMAIRLAQRENVNLFIVEMGALLHDVDDYKFRKPGAGELDHTKEIVEQYEIETKDKEQIYDIVSHVSFKGGGGLDVQKTHEGKIVQDADRLDVLGAIGIARVFAYGGVKGHEIYNPAVKPRDNISFAEYQKDAPSLNHFYEKILLLKDRLNTPQAKKIAEHRHKFIEEFLKEFWEEIEGRL
jgi:uncharacterized protein